jgi:hypothetical protein
MSSCSGSCVNGPAIPEASRSLLAPILAINMSAGEEDYRSSALHDYDEFKKSMPGFRPSKERTFSEEEILGVLFAQSAKPAPKTSSIARAAATPPAATRRSPSSKARPIWRCACPSSWKKPRVSRTTSSRAFDQPDPGSQRGSFSIQLANPAMLALLVGVIQLPKDAFWGKPVNSFFDPSLVLACPIGHADQDKKIYLADYGKYLSATITYDPRYHILIGDLYRDVTSEEKKRQKEKELAEKRPRQDHRAMSSRRTCGRSKRLLPC